MAAIHTPTSKLKGTIGGLSSKELKKLMRKHPAIWAMYSGIKVDGRDFSFDGHKFLYPLYCDRSLDLRVMKSAQMGATIWMLMRAFHQALYPESWGYKIPINVGFYFPDKPGLNMMVKSRVEPMMLTTPELLPYSKTLSRAWKPLGKSSLFFFYLKGKSSKDSMPLTSLFFDEVRLVDLHDVEQVYERVSASPIPYKCHISTAGYPEADIHKMFLDSDQKWWHTVCESCGAEHVLSLEFPDCIAEHTIGPRKGDVYYRCTKCDSEMKNTQNGLYVPHGDPNHENSGYHFSQLISHAATCHPKRILNSFRTTDNKKEWYNGKLGIPFVDASNKPVGEPELLSCVNPLLKWGDFGGSGTFMGIDQRLRENYVFILKRPPGSNKRQLVWFEIVEDEDPFHRCGQLMEEFNVKVCVADSEPNANDAMRFAQSFPKRVFLAKRGDFDDLILWSDSRKKKDGHKKAESDSYYRYRVFLDKYKDIERTLDWIKDGQFDFPDPDALTQVVTPLGGGFPHEMPIFRTHAFKHLSSPVREKHVIDEGKGKYTWVWHFIGGDPHALDALCFARAASERKMHGGDSFSYSF